MKNAAPQAEEGTIVLQSERGPIDVDTSIAPIVDALNKAGVPTIASCSGHGFRPGNIALRDGREIIIARDFEEGRLIDRLFPVGANGEANVMARTREGGAVSEFRQFCIVAVLASIIWSTFENLDMIEPVGGNSAISLLAASILSACGWVAFFGKRAP